MADLCSPNFEYEKLISIKSWCAPLQSQGIHFHSFLYWFVRIDCIITESSKLNLGHYQAHHHTTAFCKKLAFIACNTSLSFCTSLNQDCIYVVSELFWSRYFKLTRLLLWNKKLYFFCTILHATTSYEFSNDTVQLTGIVCGCQLIWTFTKHLPWLQKKKIAGNHFPLEIPLLQAYQDTEQTAFCHQIYPTKLPSDQVKQDKYLNLNNVLPQITVVVNLDTISNHFSKLTA